MNDKQTTWVFGMQKAGALLQQYKRALTAAESGDNDAFSFMLELLEELDDLFSDLGENAVERIREAFVIGREVERWSMK